MKRTFSMTIALLTLLAPFGAAQAAGNAAMGKSAAAACAECHGDNGEGMEAPKIAGLKQSELLQAMQDYKSGKRADASMKTAMSKLSDQDLENLAAYYASLK
jgi:cytochrome c553